MIYKENQSINEVLLISGGAGRVTFHYPTRCLAITHRQLRRDGLRGSLHPPSLPQPMRPVLRTRCRPRICLWFHPRARGGGAGCCDGMVSLGLGDSPFSADSAVRESQTSTCTSEINFC